MIRDLINQLGLSYDQFCELTSTVKSKNYHPQPNQDNYSIFYKKNEYIFINNLLVSIEIQNLKFLIKTYPSFKIKSGLEKNLKILSECNFNWVVYSKYSIDEYIVIQVEDYMYYEFEFEEGKFILKCIRITNLED